jgi:hypothetical protein
MRLVEVATLLMTATIAAAEKFTPECFYATIPQIKLDKMKKLIELSPIPPPFYEGTSPEFGVTRKWMSEAKALWVSKEYNWFVIQNIFDCLVISKMTRGRSDS